MLSFELVVILLANFSQPQATGERTSVSKRKNIKLFSLLLPWIMCQFRTELLSKQKPLHAFSGKVCGKWK